MLYKSKILTLELGLDSWIYIHCYEYWFMSPSDRFNHRLLYLNVWDRFYTGFVFG